MFGNLRHFYCLQDHATSNNNGEDKNKDNEETATHETNSPQDTHHQDTQDLSRDCKAWDATLAQTITEAVTREMAKAHVHYQAILNERSAATLQTSLKVSSGANSLRLWTPSIGQRANLSTRDGNCGQKKLESPLMPWRETQRKLRFLTSIIGSMEREWDTLSHGKTARPSSASQHLMN